MRRQNHTSVLLATLLICGLCAVSAQCPTGVTGTKCDRCKTGYGPGYPYCCLLTSSKACGGYGVCTAVSGGTPSTCNCPTGTGPSYPNCCTKDAANNNAICGGFGTCTKNNVCTCPSTGTYPTCCSSDCPLGSCSGTTCTAITSPWTELFSDDFDTFDTTNTWEPQRYDGCQYGICGWGNGEYEWYTGNEANVQASGGKLLITARRETSAAVLDAMVQECWDECSTRCQADGNVPGTQQFDWCMGDCGNTRCANVKSRGITSARIRTAGKFSVSPSSTYKTIKIVGRIKLPQGDGLWPAFWMLPEENSYGTWAGSGEIDVMEAANLMPKIVGSVHFGSPWPNNKYLTNSTNRNVDGSTTAPVYQTYSLIWTPTEMKWYVDDRLFATQTSANGNTASTTGWFSTANNAGVNAPFGNGDEFHLIVNLAVGGGFTGSKSLRTCQNTLSSPKTMEIDYIKVYGRAD